MSVGLGESLMRNAVLAGVILSPEPPTRWRLGQEVGDRFADVLVSWDPSHAYGHVRTLVRAQLVTPIGSSKRPRYMSDRAGVETWREWLTSPIDQRIALREALTRLRACRDRDFATMLAIIELCEAALHRLLKEPNPSVEELPLTVRLARNASRNRAVADLRWCHDARDEIAARAASNR